MTKKFLLRINEKLWEELVRWADEDLRSVNGQIEFLLRQAMEKRRRTALSPDITASEHKDK